MKQAFSEKPSQDFLARLQTSEAKPTIGFLQKQRREQARVEFEALQRRFPNILKPEEFEELYNKEEALHAGLSFLRIQTERDIEHFDPRWINLEKEKIEPQFGLGTNEPMKWSQLRNVLERQGVFNVIPESEIQARIVTARLVRLLPAYRQALREVQWAQGEDASSAMKTLKVLKRAIESIAEEFPAQFDRPAFEALRSGWAKDAKAEYDQEVAETNARNLKKEEDRWFITKLWGVGMKTAETLWVLGTVPAAEVAGFVASPFVNGSENWGRDLFQFWHKKGQAQVSGSAFGTDAEFARSSLGSLALKAVPIVQAGGAFEVALSQVGSYYDSYVKYVYDIETNEELEDLKRADGWVRGGYLAFATAEGAGSAAVILASGGTTAMGSRGAQYFAKKGIQVAANSRRAVVAGQAITVGQVAAVQTGMAFGGAISLELYHYGEDALSGKLGWDNKPRQFEWDQVLFNTYIGANQSMLFSGGMSIASKLRSAQHVSKQVALGIKPNAAVWDAANRKAAHQLSFLDLIEGSSSLPDSVDMAVAAHTTGDWRMLVGAYGATGVNLYDMKDVKDSLKGIRWQP